MQSLSSFSDGLSAIIGRPSLLRPFVCDGSPYNTNVFIVGFNPASPSSRDFWSFWDDENGFNKQRWLECYLLDRASQSGNERHSKRSPVSNTRRVLGWLEEAEPSLTVLETNIYSFPTRTASELSVDHRVTKAFEYLLEELSPPLIVTHGKKAFELLDTKMKDRKLIGVPHFSRGWSRDKAIALASKMMEELGACPRHTEL